MSSPISPVNSGTSSYGLAWKSVTVLSVDGNVAIVRDQLSQTFKMDRTNLRAKGDPPEIGETWIVDRSLANDWSFSMIVGKPIPLVRPSPVYAVANSTERDAIVAPFSGMTVFRRDLGYHEYYDLPTTSWLPTPRVGLIRRWDPTGDLTFTTTEVVDTATMVTWTADPLRRYKLTYTTRFSQSGAGTASFAIRYVAGAGPITTSSTVMLNFTVQGNGANNDGATFVKVAPPGLSGVYTIGVTMNSASGAGSSIAYGGSSGTGRTLIFEDVSLPQQ